MILPVTFTVAALFALMMFGLGMAVTLKRRSLAAPHGDAGDGGLLRRVRAHGNFAEFAPFALLLLALVEQAGAKPTFLYVLAVLIVLGRLLHAVGTYRRSTIGRALGMVLTYSMLLIAGGWLLLRAI
jgi:uncharacterized protein